MTDCFMQYTNFKSAFTMVELIFVLVIIGILGAIAIPKLNGAVEDAQFTKAKNDIATIRSSIVSKRSQNILLGQGAGYPDLNKTGSTGLFANILDYPITDKKWSSTSSTRYILTIDNTPLIFDYNSTNGSFDCTANASTDNEKKLCEQLNR